MRISDILSFMIWVPWSEVLGFWDYGTSTISWETWRTDWTPRQSRFRWMRTENRFFKLFVPSWNWPEIEMRRKLYVVTGLSYGMVNLCTGTMLNRRAVITAANCIDPYMNDVRGLRIWGLGRKGQHFTPFRYRAWRVTRLFPRSVNPEHQHGPWGYHSPRHDVAIIHSLDQMYCYVGISSKYHYPYRAFIPTEPRYILRQALHFAGSGYEYMEHVYENYKIFYTAVPKTLIRDCSEVIPKWWGKFICVTNEHHLPGVQNGGGLYDNDLIVGVGCFEIRYNEDKVFVFTDLRYYIPTIFHLAHIEPGEYYEYAYPQWSVTSGWFNWFDSGGNRPYIPLWHIRWYDMYPLGKK